MLKAGTRVRFYLTDHQRPDKLIVRGGVIEDREGFPSRDRSGQYRVRMGSTDEGRRVFLTDAEMEVLD